MQTATLDTTYDEESMMLREETIEAIKETRSGNYAGILRMKDLDSFIQSINEA